MKIKLLNFLLFTGLVLMATAVRSTTPEQQREARRFFAEYESHVKNGGKRSEAADKLNAALALQPMNQAYRYAELELYQSTCYSHDWDTWIKNIRKQLERCKKIHADFPKYRNHDWNKKMVFNEHKVFGTGRNPFREIYSRQRTSPTKSQKQQLIKLCDEMRPLLQMDLKRVFYPYDLSDGINSIKELWNYNEVIWRTNESGDYGDHVQFLRERAKAYTLMLEHVKQYVEAHPEQNAKVEKWFNPFGFDSLEHSNGSIKTNDDDVIRHLNSMQTREFIEILQKIPLPKLRRFTLLVRFKRDLINAPRTREAAITLIDNYYTAVHRIAPNVFNKSLFLGQHWTLRDGGFMGWWLKGYGAKLANERYERFRKHKNLFSINDKITALYRKKDWIKLLSYVDFMRKQNTARIKKLKITNHFSNMTQFFASKTLSKNSQAWHFFYQMNADFDVNPISYKQLFAYNKPLKIRAVLKKDDIVYLVLHENRQKFMLGLWNLKTGTKSLFPVPRKLADDFFLFGIREGHMPIRPCTPWDVDGKRIALATAKGNVIIFSLAEKKWTKLEDVVPVSARSLAIAGNSIYVLSSQKGHLGYENYLSSFDFNGKNYKINFSSVRSSPKHQVEKLNALPNSLFALNDTELVFIMSWGTATVYLYKIESDSFERICSLPQSAFADRIYPQSKFLFIQTYGHGSRVYRVDPDAVTSECVLIQDKSKHKLKLSDGFVRTNTNWDLQGPFIFSDNFIWSAWYDPAVINRQSPAESPQLFLPPSLFLTTGGAKDDAVIYFSFFRCFTVKPKTVRIAQ